MRPDRLRLERRRSPRETATGNLLAVILGDRHPAKLAPVQIIDQSEGGLGLSSALPARPGQAIGLYVPGSSNGAISGEVARCVRDGHGWRLGLRTRRRMVA